MNRPTRDVGPILDRMKLVEEAMTDMPNNDRLNLLGYMIAHYICCFEDTDEERSNLAVQFAVKLRKQFIPAWKPVHAALKRATQAETL